MDLVINILSNVVLLALGASIYRYWQLHKKATKTLKELRQMDIPSGAYISIVLPLESGRDELANLNAYMDNGWKVVGLYAPTEPSDTAQVLVFLTKVQ